MSLTILLADDSMTAQNMGKKILEDAGYNVVAVSNGAAAFRKIRESQLDLAILDIYMPGYSGLELCESIRSNAATESMPVVLTVGRMEPYRSEDGERVRANAVLVKPFASEDLVSTVRSLIGVPKAEPEPAPVEAHTETPTVSFSEEQTAQADEFDELVQPAKVPATELLAMTASAGVDAPANSFAFDPTLSKSSFSASSFEASSTGFHGDELEEALVASMTQPNGAVEEFATVESAVAEAAPEQIIPEFAPEPIPEQSTPEVAESSHAASDALSFYGLNDLEAQPSETAAVVSDDMPVHEYLEQEMSLDTLPQSAPAPSTIPSVDDILMGILTPEELASHSTSSEAAEPASELLSNFPGYDEHVPVSVHHASMHEELTAPEAHSGALAGIDPLLDHGTVEPPTRMNVAENADHTWLSPQEWTAGVTVGLPTDVVSSSDPLVLNDEYSGLGTSSDAHPMHDSLDASAPSASVSQEEGSLDEAIEHQHSPLANDAAAEDVLTMHVDASESHYAEEASDVHQSEDILHVETALDAPRVDDVHHEASVETGLAPVLAFRPASTLDMAEPMDLTKEELESIQSAVEEQEAEAQSFATEAAESTAEAKPSLTNDYARIAGAVQRVFDRMKPLMIAEIVRELSAGSEEQ